MISRCARFRCPDAQTLENTQWKDPTGGCVRMVNGPDNVRFVLGSTRKTIMHVCCKNVHILFFFLLHNFLRFSFSKIFRIYYIIIIIILLTIFKPKSWFLILNFYYFQLIHIFTFKVLNVIILVKIII